MHWFFTDPKNLASRLEVYQEEGKVKKGVQCHVEGRSYEIFQGEVQSWKIVITGTGPEVRIVYQWLYKVSLEPGYECELRKRHWRPVPDPIKGRAHVIRFPYKSFYRTSKERLKLESFDGEVCRFLPPGDPASLILDEGHYYSVHNVIEQNSRYVKHKRERKSSYT